MSSLVVAGIACSGSSTAVPPRPDGGPEQQRLPSPFLATGRWHTCAIFSAGAVRCWGENRSGQLGRSGLADPLAAYSVDLGSGRRATGVFAGLEYTCAILDSGAIKCWGDNSFGQLGLGDETNRGDGNGAMGDALPVVDVGAGRRAVAVAAGGTATCALFDDGLVKCWGDAYQGALGYGDIDTRGAAPGTMGENLPIVDLGSRGGVPFKTKQLAAIDYHSFCAIVAPADGGPDLDGSGLKCWGSNNYCEIGIGTFDGGRGGEPGMMGNNLHFVDIGTTASGARRRAVAIAGGFQFLCALGDDGAVKCWGDNGAGELGIGTISKPRSCYPEEMGNAGLVPLSAPAVAIGARGAPAGDGAHACARLATGEVTCWGENGFGQLGTGDTESRLEPGPAVVFGDGFTAESLLLGGQHSCAISPDRRVKCWGSNQDGQLGAAVPTDRHAPGADTRLAGRAVVALSAGDGHTCAVLDHGPAGRSLKCWGRNGDGQLGLGDRIDRGGQAGEMGDDLPAVDLGGGASVAAVAAGAAHTCAVLDTGGLECWGAGGSGQLGPDGAAGLLAPRSSPITLAGPAVAVAAGADFTCALLKDGQITCFGDDTRGQLGVGGGTGGGGRASVDLGSKAVALAAGAHHACALLDKGRVACWGANASGQLGLGDMQDRPRPSLVGFGSPPGAGAVAVAVAARMDTTCALMSDGQIRCWGDNARGQLGLGDTANRLAPPATSVDLGRGHSASALSVGGGFVCALLDTGQAKCWGDNGARQLGSTLVGPAYGDQPSETGDFLATAFQGGGRSVLALSSGQGHTCAILDTNDVRCWGDNSGGQLGAGDRTEHFLSFNPTAVVDLGADR